MPDSEVPTGRPWLGHGVGLRLPHYPHVLAGQIDVDWLEVITENVMGSGGRPRAVLQAARAAVPIVLHGVSLAIGSVDPPPQSYLSHLRALCDAIEPAWVSDHLCFGRIEGVYVHDLLPLPYTEEALAHTIAQIERVQDALARPLVLENVSSYVAYRHSTMPEWEFLAEIARRCGAKLLLDLNNVLVSARNFGFDPMRYVEGIPASAVWQFHLANHSDRGHYAFDDHAGAVPPAVWALYEVAIRHLGPVSTLVEWDQDVPAWHELAAQARRAATIAAGFSGTLAAPATREAVTIHREANPPRLRDTQTLFWNAIRWPTGVRAFVQDSEDAIRAALTDTFAESTTFPRAARLDVYATGYFYRLAEVLAQQFELTAWLLGAARFHNIVTDYVLEHPSRSPDIRRCGARFPAFVGAHAHARPWADLGNLADLEWRIATALDAPDFPPLTRERLAGVPIDTWPNLRFAVAPPTHVTRCRLAFERLRRELAQGSDPPAPEALSQHACAGFVVSRRDLEVVVREVGSEETSALQRAIAGEPFARICEPAGGAKEAAAWLQRWVQDAIFTEALRTA